MKKIFSIETLIFFLAVCFIAVSGGAFISVGGKAVLLAQENADFAFICKQYFKNMLDRKYADVWHLTADDSWHTIARLIARESNGKATEQQVMEMMNTDRNQIRTDYFDEFMAKAPIRILYEKGIYTLESDDGDEMLVAITVGEETLHCRILEENGMFRIDFFSVLFQ